MKKLILIISILIFSVSQLSSDNFSFRKYNHVKNFYSDIIADTIEISKKHRIPPAAVLAIAGLESGYGSGYVAQITGNILSLGAFKGDKELPGLYLPYSTSKKRVLFDPNEIKKHSKADLTWKNRPKSLKRDYRPKYAGTSKKLELLMYDNALYNKAKVACLNDFATRWINSNSKVKVFKEARLWIDKLVAQKGSDILFNMNTNMEFINRIGGVPHSYNYRKTWPKKVELIMNKVGLVELTSDIYFNNVSFDSAWRNK